ncbi:MAG: hypothetical protein F6J97_15765 [Leptolyngbya sp. SIO4C1]|nr:hypothetical protein [Leptolyngbya sp. SIO4C1]
MQRHRRSALLAILLCVIFTSGWLATGLSVTAAVSAASGAIASDQPLLQPAPNQPTGSYDLFGTVLSPAEAAQAVEAAGLDPSDPAAYQRIGAVEITPELLASGRDIFFNRGIGDMFGLQRVFGFQDGIQALLPEFLLALLKQGGDSTDGLQLRLLRNLRLGNQIKHVGLTVDTGLDVQREGFFLKTLLQSLLQGRLDALLPIGLKLPGDITCAVCHASLLDGQQVLDGVPNGNLNVAFFIALAPNSAAGFARLAFDPLDPQYQGSGKTIIGSDGSLIELPDPVKFERAFDDAVLDVPQGNFESSPDGINNTTQIPTVFTFKTRPYGFDGGFAVGPFGGLSAINNAVHSSEVNLLAAAQKSAETLGIDPELYLGTVLQNAVDPTIRLPEGDPVQPSVWLRQVAPELCQAELEDQIPAPNAGEYPELHPSLFTYNGLIFTPKSDNPDDIASGPFLFANNAMSAWQNTLNPPPNRSSDNRQALATGSVERGAKIFEQANCVSCHPAPFFADQTIHPLAELNTNPARAKSRLGLNDFLVPPQIYTLNTPVPVPANAEVLDLPTEGIAATPTSLPIGLLPDGGYKTLPLRGLFASAPYLHDGGVAVKAGALQMAADGSFEVIDPTGLGLAATLSRGMLPDAASSLRALVDRQLRAQVVAANQASPALVGSNLDGTGHDFYVDAAAGYTPSEQTDLVNFLMALDDKPGEY